MVKLGHPLLPLNQLVVSKAQKLGIRFTDKTYVVAVQHLLDDTFDLYQSLIALGILPQNIFTLGKIYSNIPRILGQLENNQIQLVRTNPPPLGEFYSYFYNDVSSLWNKLQEIFRLGKLEQILILDDGGILISKTPKEFLDNFQLTGEE